MKAQKRPSLASAEGLFLTLFGVGFIPYAPGTWGSLVAAFPLYALSALEVPSLFLIPFTILLTIGACMVAQKEQVRLEVQDPSWIVVDEFLGMLVAWIICPTKGLLDLFCLFALFRAFDIFKLWPADVIDKKLKHGAGTILDDVVSGIYAGLVGLLLQHFLPLA